MTIAIILICIVLVLGSGYLFGGHEWFQKWFGDSETLVMARLSVLLGILDTALPLIIGIPNLIPPEYMPYWLLGSGILAEVARRLRADDLG